jgi:ribosome recycling factor
MDDSYVDAVFDDTREKMTKAAEHARAELASIRTGRAVPALVERLRVELDGYEATLQQIAGIQAPEARMLVISPYDKTHLRAIERSIQSSDLGVNPNTDGAIIRLTFPPLTEERRRALVKVAHSKAEDGRVAVRGVRRGARKDLEALEKDGDITSDELERAEKELERLTHEYVTEEELLAV